MEIHVKEPKFEIILQVKLKSSSTHVDVAKLIDYILIHVSREFHVIAAILALDEFRFNRSGTGVDHKLFEFPSAEGPLLMVRRKLVTERELLCSHSSDSNDHKKDG
ncbi:hypothetical protein D3C85_1260140 [compost metagenome]